MENVLSISWMDGFKISAVFCIRSCCAPSIPDALMIWTHFQNYDLKDMKC